MSRWIVVALLVVLLLGEWSTSPAMTAERFAEQAKDPISFDFVDTPLEDTLEFFSGIMSNAVIQHPGTAEIEVTHKCEDMPLSKALTDILEPHGLEWAFMREALYVAPPDAIAAAKAAPTIDRDAPGFDGKLKRRVSFHLKDVPLAAITQFLGQLEQIPVHQLGLGLHDYRHKDAKAYGTKVSLRLQDAELGTFIEWVGILSGQSASIRDGKITFGDPDPPKRTKLKRPRVFLVRVNAEGQMEVRKRVVDSEALVERIRERLAKYGDMTVVVRGDPRAHYTHILPARNAFAKAGVKNVRIVHRPMTEQSALPSDLPAGVASGVQQTGGY